MMILIIMVMEEVGRRRYKYGGFGVGRDLDVIFTSQ